MCDCAVDKAQALHLLDCHLQEKIDRRETKYFDQIQVIDSPPKDHLQGGLNVDPPKQDCVDIPPVQLSLAATPAISIIIIYTMTLYIICPPAIGNVCMTCTSNG